jgi:hypothetical protein
MSDENENKIITVQSGAISTQLLEFEKSLLSFIDGQGLPTETVLVDVGQRQVVIRNIDAVLDRIDDERLGKSVYISKFIAATASGLFDAALNYLWDETIYELRKRVAQYDLAYFYDVAVGSSTEKRKRLSTEEDLQKVDDSDLIKGANEIGLISDLGFRHLDFVRYMRNWASAAHPNQNQITGLQLISMLETCVVEVIKLPLSNVVVEIKRLLGNIKNNKITQDEASQIAVFFAGLTQEKANTLASGLYGIYTQLDTTPQTRQNIQLLIPLLWEMVDENTRNEFGVRYARFIATNDQDRQKIAREFLDVVSGAKYLPEGIRVVEIGNAIENLLTAHRGLNNFYNEPAFARQLQRQVGETGKVPNEINIKYVLSIVEAFLTNGNGVAWNAEVTYIEMFNQFDSTQASIAVFSFVNKTISSRLQFPLCQKQFRRLVDLMRDKVTIPVVKELVSDIDSYTGAMENMKDDTRIKSKANAIRRIVSP